MSYKLVACFKNKYSYINEQELDFQEDKIINISIYMAIFLEK